MCINKEPIKKPRNPIVLTINTLSNELGLKSGKKRLIILFRIDKKGSVTDIKAKAPHKTLKLEAIRVIKLLPKMNPGEQDGEIVDVKYTLPVRIDVK